MLFSFVFHQCHHHHRHRHRRRRFSRSFVRSCIHSFGWWYLPTPFFCINMFMQIRFLFVDKSTISTIPSPLTGLTLASIFSTISFVTFNTNIGVQLLRFLTHNKYMISIPYDELFVFIDRFIYTFTCHFHYKPRNMHKHMYIEIWGTIPCTTITSTKSLESELMLQIMSNGIHPFIKWSTLFVPPNLFNKDLVIFDEGF